MHRRAVCKGIISLAGVVLTPLGAFAKVQEAKRQFREVRHAMGTLLDIAICHNSAKAAREFFDAAFSLVARLELLLSNFYSESEISRLNSLSGKESLRISKETEELLVIGKRFFLLTDRAFDISVRPLIELWRRGAVNQFLPDEKEIQRVKSLVGCDCLEMDGDGRALLAERGASIETGGIGKGLAVDRITSLFKRFDIESAFVNFGHSTIYAHGVPSMSENWEVLLQFPGAAPIGTLAVRDCALSASSSFGQSFSIGQKQYGHIFDPLTGLPFSSKREIALTTRSAVDAEILSTYLVIRPGFLGDNLQSLPPFKICHVA